jgi:hypothetical protein
MPRAIVCSGDLGRLRRVSGTATVKLIKRETAPIGTHPPPQPESSLRYESHARGAHHRLFDATLEQIRDALTLYAGSAPRPTLSPMRAAKGERNRRRNRAKNRRSESSQNRIWKDRGIKQLYGRSERI